MTAAHEVKAASIAKHAEIFRMLMAGNMTRYAVIHNQVRLSWIGGNPLESNTMFAVSVEGFDDRDLDFPDFDMRYEEAVQFAATLAYFGE